MSISSWFPWKLARQQKGQTWRSHASKLRRGARLAVEQLEDRTVPSNWLAANVTDLITYINQANYDGGSNTITLTAPTTSPYTLTAGLSVAANNNLTIIGNGDTIERSTASGTPLFRLFYVAAGASLTVTDATLQGGGQGIANLGTLDLKGVTVQNNSGGLSGGGIYSSGSLILEAGTIIRGNQVVGHPGSTYSRAGDAFGGGVYVAGGTATLTDTIISGNTAKGGTGYEDSVAPPLPFGGNGYGGGLYVAAGTVTLTNVTLSSNEAVGGDTYSRINVGGTPGYGAGGGLYAAGGTVTLRQDSVTGNSARGGAQNGHGNKSSQRGLSAGGGLYIASTATIYLDAFTLSHAKSNKPDDIYGSYMLIT